MKTILNAVQNLINKKIKASTADWNQNDPSAPDYVKHRTHWEKEENVIVLNETTVTITDDYYDFGNIPYGQLIAGQTYYVTLNGVEYKCVARYCNDYVLIGNGTIYGDGDVSNNEPFSCDSYSDGNIYLNAAVGEYTISISGVKTVIHKLDSKYLDLPTNLATTDDMEEVWEYADSAYSYANDAYSLANTKMNATNPTGTGSFSMNISSDYNNSIGEYSCSLGLETLATRKSQNVTGEYNKPEKSWHFFFNSANQSYAYLYKETVSVSTSYTIDSLTGEVTLINPSTVTLTAGGSTQELRNKYVYDKSDSGKVKILWMSSDFVGTIT